MKNVRVTDSLGKDYEPTYLRRAKGLVKKAGHAGRALMPLPDVSAGYEKGGHCYE